VGGDELKYIASIAAVHASGKGMFVGHLPVRIEATDYKEADQKALEIALQRWPKEEGWTSHDAVSLLA